MVVYLRDDDSAEERKRSEDVRMLNATMVEESTMRRLGCLHCLTHVRTSFDLVPRFGTHLLIKMHVTLIRTLCPQRGDILWDLSGHVSVL